MLGENGKARSLSEGGGEVYAKSGEEAQPRGGGTKKYTWEVVTLGGQTRGVVRMNMTEESNRLENLRRNLNKVRNHHKIEGTGCQ